MTGSGIEKRHDKTGAFFYGESLPHRSVIVACLSPLYLCKRADLKRFADFKKQKPEEHKMIHDENGNIVGTILAYADYRVIYNLDDNA